MEVPYRGDVNATLLDVLGGIRSACTYTGAGKLKEMSKRTTFIRVSQQLNEVFSGGKNTQIKQMVHTRSEIYNMLLNTSSLMPLRHSSRHPKPLLGAFLVSLCLYGLKASTIRESRCSSCTWDRVTPPGQIYPNYLSLAEASSCPPGPASHVNGSNKRKHCD